MCRPAHSCKDTGGQGVDWTGAVLVAISGRRDRVRVRPSMRRGGAGRAHPLPEHRQAHDAVPDDDDGVVEVAVLDGVEQVGDAEREDDDTDHLHHRQQPVQPVVGVVCTHEPRVVDPLSDDAEAREAERSDARRDVPVRE